MHNDTIQIVFPIERPHHPLSDNMGRLVLLMRGDVRDQGQAIKLSPPPYRIINSLRSDPSFFYGGLPPGERQRAVDAIADEWLST